MGTKYSTVTVTSYNASPPADDGSQSASNQITWAKHKTKLGDPLKTAIEAIDTALVAALNQSAIAKTDTYTVTAAEHAKTIEVTTASAGCDIILLAAVTAAAGFYVHVVNSANSTSALTVKVASGNTLNETTNGTISMPVDSALTFIVDSNVSGWNIRGSHGIAVSGNTVYQLATNSILRGESSFLYNVSLSTSVAANNLTVTLNQINGSAPTSVNPSYVAVRSATTSTGAFTVHKITSALNLVVSDGATLGTLSGLPARLYIALVDDSGTPALGIWNPLLPFENKGASAFSTGNYGVSISALDDSFLYSSTAITSTADSAQTLYTQSAVTSRPIRLLGYIETTQTTAGVWAVNASKVHLLMPGDKRTGDIIQTVYGTQIGSTSTTNTSATDISGGSLSITLKNRVNIVNPVFRASSESAASANNNSCRNSMNLVRVSDGYVMATSSTGGGAGTGSNGFAGQNYTWDLWDWPRQASETYKLQHYGTFYTTITTTTSGIQMRINEIMV